MFNSQVELPSHEVIFSNTSDDPMVSPSMQIDNDNNKITIINTNIIDIEITQGTLQRNKIFYIFKVYQAISNTHIDYLQINSDRRILVTLSREHIDRSQMLPRILQNILSIFEKSSILNSFIHNLDLVSSSAVDAMQQKVGDFIISINTYSSGDQVINVRLQSVSDPVKPILTYAFEVIDGSALR